MHIPNLPEVVPLKHLSPSQYEAGRVCMARLAWTTAGSHRDLPDHPNALLGTCFHTVVEAAAIGRFAEQGHEAVGMAAREMFDHFASTAYGRAHDLLRVKYRSVEELPYYHLFRERAALTAINVAERRGALRASAEFHSRETNKRRLIEVPLTSANGLLSGRPDYIDLEAQEILDYKTGAGFDAATPISPSEVRQLSLYVHLALENDLWVTRGVILRPGCGRAVADVTKDQADAEAGRAREVLENFNRLAGRSFDSVAQPSAEACRFCPCIPFCESFWRDAANAWEEDCGTHLEGRITAITESKLQSGLVLTLDLEVNRGTLDAARAFIEQLPESWTLAGGSPRPEIGDVVRVIHGRKTLPGLAPVIRVDRALTTVWTIPNCDASSPERSVV